MKLVVKLFGIIFLLLGLSVLIKPDIILVWIENNMESTYLYISAIVVRLVFGVLFIVTAKESKYPTVITYMGYLFITAAIIFLFIGQENFQDFITFLIPQVKPFAPLAGLLSIALGGFLVYSFSRDTKFEQK